MCLYVTSQNNLSPKYSK